MASNYIVSGSVGRLLREEMANLARHMIESDQDPVTRGIVLNTAAVTTSSRLGRPPAGTKTGTSQFEAIHPIQFGRAGVITYASMATLLGNDHPPRIAKTSYPSATTVPQREVDWFLIPLKWIMGNLAIEHRQLLALSKGVMVEDFLASWLKDPITIIHQQLTTDFFGNGVGQLGTVYSQPTDVEWVAGVPRVITLGGSCRPFWRGQRLKIWDASANAFVATTFTVTKVFSFTGSVGTGTQKIELVGDDTVTYVYDVTHIDSLHLIGATTNPETPVRTGVQGLESFVINPAHSGTDLVLHGLTVYTHATTTWEYPELISYYDVPATDRWPTPRVFEIAMDAISDRGFDAPDRWILPRGLRSLFYNVEGFNKVYNTDQSSGGVMGHADGGIAGPMSITSEKGRAEVVISGFCPAKTAYGIRLDGLVRYAPEGLEAVQWLGDNPLTGSAMFFVATDTSGDRTTVFEAPFNYFVEMGCLKPQCLAKVGSLKELSGV